MLKECARGGVGHVHFRYGDVGKGKLPAGKMYDEVGESRNRGCPICFIGSAECEQFAFRGANFVRSLLDARVL